MSRRRWLAGIAFLACTGPAAAGEIHQCRSPTGGIVYQDRPCAAGQQPLSTRAVDEAAPSATARAAARAEQQRIAAWERASRDRLAPSLGGRASPAARASAPATPSRAAPRDACAQARAAREDAYRRDGNRMDFDRRRALQDAVTAACGLR